MRKKITNFVLNKIHEFSSLLHETSGEGSTIRSSRLRKFKSKGKGISIAAQIIAIWYLSIFAGAYFTSNTGAYFNDIETIENFLGAANEFPGNPDEPEEWDRSSLSFTNVAGFCTKDFEGVIYSKIANVGDELMEGTTTYYIYRVDLNDSGPNKENKGEMVHEGEVPALPGKNSSNNSTLLTYNPDLNTMSPGKYKFMAEQRPNHGNPNNNPNKEEEQELWGEEIEITQADIDACQAAITPQEPPTEVPVASEVKGLKETHNTNSIKLTWSNPTENFAHVNIFRNGQVLANNITNNSFEDKELNTATEYIYKITVVDQSGKETEGIIIKVKTDPEIIEDTQAPGEVINTSWREKGESGKIEITWDRPADTDFSHVKIYRDDVLIVENTRDKSFSEKISSAEHEYKIIAVDKSGNESAGVIVTVTK